MNMYSKITNPRTGRKVSVKSRLGKKILRQYLEILTGGAGPDAMALFILSAQRRRALRAAGGGGGADAPELARSEVAEPGVMGPASDIMDFVGPPEILVGMLYNRVSAEDSGIPERETSYYEPLGVVSDLFEISQQEPAFQYTIIKLEDDAHIMDELIPNHDAFLLLNIEEEYDAAAGYDDIIEVISNQLSNAKIIFIDRTNPAARPTIIRPGEEEGDEMVTVREQVQERVEHVGDSYMEALNRRRFHYRIDLGDQSPSSYSRFTIELQALSFTDRPTQLQLVVNLVIR